eukprot:11004-Eustigmatos_ZCMA.PRE.1
MVVGAIHCDQDRYHEGVEAEHGRDAEHAEAAEGQEPRRTHHRNHEASGDWRCDAEDLYGWNDPDDIR